MVGGRDAVFPAGNEFWEVNTAAGGANWNLMGRQAAAWAARDAGGTALASTWYKIIVEMDWGTVTATIYNPDETVNDILTCWIDNQPAAWSYYLENAASAVPTTTLYDLFIVQGNTGYSKTLPFTGDGETLLMPDDYVFNGTANNHQIRFQVAATIALVQNRLIQLVAPCVLYMNFYDLDGWGVEFVKCRVYINGTRLNDPTFTNTSAIWHYFNILVTDYYGNTIYSNPSYPVTQSPLTADIQLQLVRVRLVSATGTANTVWIDQVGSGVNPKNMTFYGSGETQLYATALGITYRFYGYLNSSTFTAAQLSVNTLVNFDTGNILITTAQNRLITVMTDLTLIKMLQDITTIKDKPPDIQAGGGLSVSDYKGTTPDWAWWVIGIVGLVGFGSLFTIAYYGAKGIEAQNTTRKVKEHENDTKARIKKIMES
jgi:hypothetical protein